MAISDEFTDDTAVPRTYLIQQGGSRVRLDLTREQFEEFESRDVEMNWKNGGVEIRTE